jgi:hypothetical protein
MMRSLFALALALSVLAGCARDAGPYPNLPFIGIAGDYGSRNLCSLGQSPEFRIYGAPAGAARYRVKITNVTALTGPSWTAETQAGATIPEGALSSVPNPCPPETGRYMYRIEVMALSGDGRPLAYGWNFINVASLPRRLEIERDSLPSSNPAPLSAESLRPPYFVY